MANLTYTRNGDYYIPDLILTEQSDKLIGKYGRMRKWYLKENHPTLYSSLILSEKLYPHLLEIDETANRRLEIMMPELMKSAGVTESLKAIDPMKWVERAKGAVRRNHFIRTDLRIVNNGRPRHSRYLQAANMFLLT